MNTRQHIERNSKPKSQKPELKGEYVNDPERGLVFVIDDDFFNFELEEQEDQP